MSRSLSTILLSLALLASPAMADTKRPLVVGTNGQPSQLQPGSALQLPASSGAAGSLNMPHGVAPSAPQNGDCWTTTAGFFCRINGTTKGPFDQRYAPITADALARGDAVTTSGSATFSSAGRACAAGDAGKVIVVAGAGAASAPLKTTIAGCSGANYTLSAVAGSSVSGEQWGMGTDNSALLNTLVAANPGGTLILPPGGILLDSTTVNLNNITLVGQGAGTRGVAFANPTAYGTTLLLTSLSTQPFIVTRGVRLQNLSFLWPGQTGPIATPVAYPPLITTFSGGSGDIWIEGVTVLNAYDFFTQHPNCNGEGGLHVENSNVYAVRRGFSVCGVGETHSVNGSIFNPSVYYEGTVNRPNQYLIKWSLANGDWMYVFGNGTASTCSSTIVGGFLIGSGTTINGYRRAMHVVGGVIDETVFGDDTDINGVHQILVVEADGFVSHLSMLGHAYPNGKPGLKAEYPAFDFQGTCSAGYPGDIKVGGRLIGPEAGVFNVKGTNLERLTISVDVKNYGDNGAPSAPMYFADVNNPNVALSITDSMIRSSVQGSNNRGTLVTSARSVNFTGNTCENVWRCIDVSGLATNKYTIIAGNNAMGSSDTYAAYGTLMPSVVAAGNTFDRINPGFDGLQGPQQSTNSWVASPVYHLPTANGQTYAFTAGLHQVTIDNLTNSVTTAIVTLPPAPADGYVVKIAGSAALTTLTVNPSAGDITRCGSGALAAGASLGCVFRRGIGATSPNGAWFTY